MDIDELVVFPSTSCDIKLEKNRDSAFTRSAEQGVALGIRDCFNERRGDTIMNVPDLSKCQNDEERKVFNTIIGATLSSDSWQYVFPQYEVVETYGTTRKLDFAIITSRTRIAIELDGYKYHAEGVVTREQFDDGLRRQNELILDGWKVIRWSWNQITFHIERCKDELRRALISDPFLHPSLNGKELKPHIVQREALDSLAQARANGARRGLVVMATGLGKTYLSAFDAKTVGGKVLFIVHNNSILEQAREAFKKVFNGPSMGLFNGYEKAADSDILFANVNTLSTWLSKFDAEHFDYVVVDEFHHGATDRYRRVINHFQPKFFLGLTATPNRTDKQSILDLVDHNVIYQMTQTEAVNRGFLVPFHYYGLKDNVDYSSIRHNGFRYNIKDLNRSLIIASRDQAIMDKYQELARGTQAIAFCVSIEHAERSADNFNSKGIPSRAVHSHLDYETRRQYIDDFRAGKYQIVFVRDIFNEGIDFPNVETLIFMRPTESRIIFIQQLGRGLRLSEGKKAVKVLDFIGNYIHAEQIPDYLSEMTGKEERINLEEKPVFHYDNGCLVEFSEETVEIISAFNTKLITTQQIIEDFLLICKQLGRTPTFVEIQTLGNYKVPDYVSEFGSWDGFIERMLQLDPDIDFSKTPSKFGNVPIEDYLTTLDGSYANFKDMLLASAQAIQQVYSIFQKLNIQLRDYDSSAAEFIRNILKSVVGQCAIAVEWLQPIALTLSYRFESPMSISKARHEPTQEQRELINSVISNLVWIVDKHEFYSYPKLFVDNSHIVKDFVTLADTFDTPNMSDEFAAMESLYSLSLSVIKFIVRASESSEVIIRWIEEEFHDYFEYLDDVASIHDIDRYLVRHDF